MGLIVVLLAFAGSARADVTVDDGPLEGVTVTALAPEAAGDPGGRGGVLVTGVEKGSPASGLLRRGDIVTSVNHERIGTEADFVRVAKEDLPSEIAIDVRRR
jgi:S1-C subfamily serine protease